ncbi:SpoIIE family protein phosphatase [Streptomyces fructofermentans]
MRPRAFARTSLPGNHLAPGAARRFVRCALADWTELALPGAEFITDLLVADAMVIVSELVTNAVVHAGTDVDLLCRLDPRPEEYPPPAPKLPDAARDIARDGSTAAMPDGVPVVGVPVGGVSATAVPPGADGRQPEPGALVLEVSDNRPARGVRDEGDEDDRYADGDAGTDDDGDERPRDSVEYGRGVRLVSTLSDAWGITYRAGTKTVWARLPVEGVALTERAEAYAGEHALLRGQRAAEILAPAYRRSVQDQEWLNRGALSFLAEASDLLAGQLDEDLVAVLTGQLLVPRLADWCAVWLEDEAPGRMDGVVVGGPRLARVWHGSENRIEELRRVLEKDPPEPPEAPHSGPVAVRWPAEALGARGATGSALAYRLVAGGRPLGTLVIGRAGLPRFPDEITGLVEDLSRRVALAIGAARQYARQATISRVLQRGLLPGAVAEIPGVRSALVYEPCDKGGPSGDFYDLFPAGDGRWCFALGDVQGKGPEAAVVIGLARPWLRLLAREGYEVPDVLDRLNQLLLDDATEVSDAAARALVAAGGRGLAAEGPQNRFLSLLYGELVPFDGGVRCTVASAGHPLPLLLDPTGGVRETARPQTILGVFEDAAYRCETFDLCPGESLLCVTDGVTERRSGHRQFDDDEGLAAALADCAGLSAELIAERIRRLVHEFGPKPPEDDLALLVLQAE